MKSIFYFCLAAALEIAGCFSFWAYFRLQRHPLWLAPGLLALALFAHLLTRVEVSFAGRAYAAYGGIYIAASLVWMWAVERTVPDRYDLLGSAFCLAGAGVVLFAPRIS